MSYSNYYDGFEELNDDSIRRAESAYNKWVKAKHEKKWRRADALRGYLIACGWKGVNYDRWSRVFEEPSRRKRRISRLLFRRAKQ